MTQLDAVALWGIVSVGRQHRKWKQPRFSTLLPPPSVTRSMQLAREGGTKRRPLQLVLSQLTKAGSHEVCSHPGPG